MCEACNLMKYIDKTYNDFVIFKFTTEYKVVLGKARWDYQEEIDAMCIYSSINDISLCFCDLEKEAENKDSDGHITIIKSSGKYGFVHGTPNLDTTYCFGYVCDDSFGLMISGEKPFYFSKEFYYDYEGLAIIKGSESLQGAIENAIAGNKVDYKKYVCGHEMTRWDLVRENAKHMAGYRCQLCGREGSLHAHHRTYENLGHEKPGDVIALCAKCHKMYHDSKKRSCAN